MAPPYLELALGFMAVVYFFETYLLIRQLRALKLPTLPKALQGIISQEKFEKSRAYSIDRCHYIFVRKTVSTLLSFALLFFGLLPWFWQKSGEVVVDMGLNADNETIHTLAFLVGVKIWSEITELPSSLYSTFVIEARHGFNKQTVWLFFRDMLKEILIEVLVVPPIVAAIIFIVQKGGPYLAVYLWGFVLVLQILLMTLRPVLIDPLFNKFTPLPEGELKHEIEKLASSLDFPLKKLFVVDGSTRSSHSNAYMYGFFKNKRIVIYDTLIEQYKNVEEVVAVIAHELGHWKLKHNVYSLISTQILLFLQFGGFALVRNSKGLFQSFGFQSQPYTISPIQRVVRFALNIVSRAFEFQADAFAKKLGFAKPLRSGLVKMQEANLTTMNTDSWYSAYHFSHPPLVERLAAIDQSADNKKEN